MDKSCLDCKHATFSIFKGKEGECEWKLPSKSPVWLSEYPFGTVGVYRINKNRPYVDCPAWEEVFENKIEKGETMKLEDFFDYNNFYVPTPLGLRKEFKSPPGLHVIGTCGECAKSGECDIATFIHINRGHTKDFGCTHFEEKEKASFNAVLTLKEK